MRLSVEEISNLAETEVIVKCRERSGEVLGIVATLRLFENNIAAKKEGESFIIAPSEILYFESVNDRVFCYTERDTYETAYRLYELEERFLRSTFLRINKNIILNASKISCFSAALNGRMEARLINGEKVEISRNYVPALKLLLGGMRK